MNAFHSLEVVDIRRESFDSVSLAFKIPDVLRETFRFTPGQYVTLRTEFAGEECRRAYSICSGVGEKDLRVAIKQTPHGLFSTFANSTLQSGARLDVMPPQGRFTADEKTRGGHFVFFVAGSGITPALSIIKTTLSADPDARITLFYGNKTTSSIMFRETLEQLKDIYLSRLSVFHVLSRESQDIALLDGRIDREKIALLARSIVPPTDVTTYFLCGPYGMVEEAHAALVAAAATPSQIKMELFSTDGMAKPQPVIVAAKGETPSVASTVHCILDGVTFQLEVQADAHVVDAAHEQGVELPYSCKGGMCCTCRCKVVKGEIVMDVNYSLEPWELEAGFVLACQARPVSAEIILDFDAV